MLDSPINNTCQIDDRASRFFRVRCQGIFIITIVGRVLAECAVTARQLGGHVSAADHEPKTTHEPSRPSTMTFAPLYRTCQIDDSASRFRIVYCRGILLIGRRLSAEGTTTGRFVVGHGIATEEDEPSNDA